MIQPQVVLTDPTLFGNDAAEDEAEEVFNAYAIERPEVTVFARPDTRLAIARAYKGEGKSALLRMTKKKVELSPSSIALSRTAFELSPEVERDDYATWLRAWKAAIMESFAREIGSRIGMAWTDDAMALVEEAEKSGFKQRSFLTSILERLGISTLPTPAGSIPIPQITRLGASNPQEVVRRWNDGHFALWLFVDDVDKNFRNISNDKLRVASFFDACRELGNVLPELRIRSAIRPNVWAIVKLEYESLSHVEQYTLSLSWAEEEIRALLSKRIEGYLRRQGKWESFAPSLSADIAKREKAVITLAFDDPMQWSGDRRPAHVILYTLSKHRPRWVIELARVSAVYATKERHSRITLEDITSQLITFGERRIKDTVAEFRPQCSDIEELVMAFSREKEEMTTDDLFRIINNKILTHVGVQISGVIGKPSAAQVASMLFEIGLFYGRRDLVSGEYEHVSYSDNPSLLRSRTSSDSGLVWEIHPVFRQALEMRDKMGREIPRPRRK